MYSVNVYYLADSANLHVGNHCAVGRYFGVTALKHKAYDEMLPIQPIEDSFLGIDIHLYFYHASGIRGWPWCFVTIQTLRDSFPTWLD